MNIGLDLHCLNLDSFTMNDSLLLLNILLESVRVSNVKDLYINMVLLFFLVIFGYSHHLLVLMEHTLGSVASLSIVFTSDF